MKGPELPRKILIRTRGNHQQGMGDLVGSEALGRAFRSQGMEVAVLAEQDPEATNYLKKAGLAHFQATHTAQDCRIVREWSPDCLVVNMLRSDLEYLKILRPLVQFLVTVDDDGPAATLADLCINPLYPVPGALSSPDFIPLKSEFQELHRQTRTWRPQVKNILVSLGGADTYGFSPLVVRAISSIPEEISLKVIIGPAFRHEAEMQAALEGLAGRSLEWNVMWLKWAGTWPRRTWQSVQGDSLSSKWHALVLLRLWFAVKYLKWPQPPGWPRWVLGSIWDLGRTAPKGQSPGRSMIS